MTLNRKNRDKKVHRRLISTEHKNELWLGNRAKDRHRGGYNNVVYTHTRDFYFWTPIQAYPENPTLTDVA
jgi:hypothetical protein